jgi:hypothetical protein
MLRDVKMTLQGESAEVDAAAQLRLQGEKMFA